MNSYSHCTVLVVDDTEANIDILVETLGEDYDVAVAMDGPSALDLAMESPPDLILLDVMMPGMNGYEVCSKLKEDPRTRDVPVIFVTAMTEAEDETKGFELGAMDYITKPISPPIVKSRVGSAIALRQKTLQMESLSLKLSKYLSPQVYDSIFSGVRDATLSTERKKLTVFFSDIKDFTLTTDDLQPEDLTNLLNRYFTEMSDIAMEHGATIDKFIGDAMLMFFGDPETKGVEEDAKACVRMAMAMQRRMAGLEEEWKAQGYEKPFKMRVGINTGYCNVGNFGSANRMDYTIIGGEVNLAARLEAQADTSGILMSYETYALVKDIVQADTRPPPPGQGHPPGSAALCDHRIAR
jgi:adenylate cyclase